MSLKISKSSKWGKLLQKNSSPTKPNFTLNNDVTDFLKPSTEKERIPGEGTRHLAGPRLDVSTAQRWPEAAEVKRVLSSETQATAKPRRKLNLTVGFVRGPPEIIGEGGDESEIPVSEIGRNKAKLARSKTERRQGAPVLDTRAADAHRQAKDEPRSAPGEGFPPMRFPPRTQFPTSPDPTHPSKHPFFSSPAPPTEEVHNESPRPGIKRVSTTFSSLEDQVVPWNGDHAPSPVDEESPSPVDNPELLDYLQPSVPQSRNITPETQARQNHIRAEEGRVLRRLSRLDFDEAQDPRRPSSPDSPQRTNRSRSPHFTEPQPMVIPGFTQADVPQQYTRPVSPEDAPAPIYVPNHRHPLPQVPHQDEDYTTSRTPVPHIQTRNLQVSDSSSNHHMRSVSSSSDFRQRCARTPSDPVSVMSSNSAHYNTLHPQHAGNHYPAPPMINRGPSPSYFSPHTLAPQMTQNPNGLTPQIPGSPYERKNFSSSQATLAVSEPSGRACSVSSQPISVTPSEPGTEDAEQHALFDFGTRVAHTKGVFRLTAERERPAASVTTRQWLRAAIWWLHKGRAGLTVHMRNSRKGPDGQIPEMLVQAHVDIAKTWWILTDILNMPITSHSRIDSPQDTLLRDIEIARSSLRSFTLSMSRNKVMPPHQSLIQGQSTAIWVVYPRFASDISSLLRGDNPTGIISEVEPEEFNPLQALPLGDTRNTFCYNRMFVNASINTDEAESDRIVLPCILTMLRSMNEYQSTVVISSQTDLVNVIIKPGDGGFGKGPTWHDVTWKGNMNRIHVRLPRGFTLTVEMQEADFRSLYGLVDYTNKVKDSTSPKQDERLIHETDLVELQHTDSSNAHAFPRNKIRSCTATLFEKRITCQTGFGKTELHRGYRLLLSTKSINKTLSTASLELCLGSPLMFEMSSGNETPSMTILTEDEKRQCQSHLVFRSSQERQALYDKIQGIATSEEEHVSARVGLRNMVMETSAGQGGSIAGAFQGLKWQEMRVITEANAEVGQDQGDMTLSQHFRIVAMHDGGAVTDRLNLGPGELLVRLPATVTPDLTILRAPQDDMTVSLDTRKAIPQGKDKFFNLVQKTATTPTLRTMSFPSLQDLHTFQQALTRYSVRYDGAATTFAISRRRMVVPIYKKLEATKVRIQVLNLGSVTKITAFFENFSQADAMVFQVKSTDTFEKVKGDKAGKYCVKFVDAKFSLPKKEKDKDVEGGEDEPPSDAKVWGKGVRRRFINMEGLEYASEHDDITIGFETEAERDGFSEALPAPPTAKKFQVMRRI